ncbi:MAG: hypothetical protein LBN95_01285 [Prevotellaceae bacterium]|jgi:hypothetical protein|nr:hypothetical protein [Prevotellaceae bacterium]
MRNKIFYYAVTAVLIAVCCACGNEADKIKAENDSLKEYCAKIEQDVNFYFATMNEIHSNLENIKACEDKIIELSLENNGNFTNKEIKTLLSEIASIIHQSKTKIDQLNERLLKNQTINISELNAAAQRLTQDVELKNAHISDMTEELKKRAELISQQDLAIRGLKQENEIRSRIINEKEQQINTGWYVFASRKVLSDNAVITGSGIFNSSKMFREDFNDSIFTKIDLLKNKTFKINSKSAKILTIHPKNSYSLKKDNENSFTLTILAPTDFWSVSRYLVVQTK